MSRKILGVALAIGALAGGAFVLHHRRQALSQMAPPASVPIPVDVARVTRGTVSETIDTLAVVESGQAATLAAQTSGTLVDVRPREGDAVARGELLARIDPRVLDDALAAAEARVAAARVERSTLEAVTARDQVLFDHEALSRQALDASQARVEGARSGVVAAERALETARTLRSYSDLRAPFAGVVTARLVEVGDLAAPGKSLFTLQSPGPVRVAAKLAQEALARLRPGDGAVFSLGERTLAATVTRLFPALDSAHLGTAESDLDGAPFGLAPGSTLAVRFEPAGRQGLVVPAAALLAGTDRTLVVRADGNVATPVPVTLLATDGDRAVVAGAISEGDLVVVGLPSELLALTAGTSIAPVAGGGS
jgi:RND family efflux transporter MFP subunit